MKEDQEQANRPPSASEYAPHELRRIRLRLNVLFAKATRTKKEADWDEFRAFSLKHVRTEETKIRIRGKAVYLDIVAPLQEGRILVDSAGQAKVEITDGQHRSGQSEP